MSTIYHKITAGPFQENGYIVKHSDEAVCIIVDPGFSPDLYIKKIEENNLKPVAILNTHGHLDHIHAVQPLKDYFKIPFYIHSNEKIILDHYPQSCVRYGFAPNQIPHVDCWIDDTNNLSIDKFNIKIVQTPGHTPGGICIQINKDLFTGDTLFKGSIGRTDLPGGDYNLLMESIGKLISQIPRETAVHPGHGLSSTIDFEIASNPFLQGL